MKYLFILSLIVFSACASSLQFEKQLLKDLFQQWKEANDKHYSSQLEEERRFNIFMENYIFITESNARETDIVLGLNEFADMTLDEFYSLYSAHMGKVKYEESNPFVFNNSEVPPSSVDWRAKGAVTAIKNQQACGSCWAFGSVGGLEALHFINTSALIDFSEQQVIDCARGGAEGCQGGWPMEAFNYTAKYGIESAVYYPDNGGQTNCSYNESLAYKVNDGYYNITPMNVTQLKLAVAQQPVTVLIQAYGLHFMYYRSGVMKHICGWQTLDHVVLIVGYGMINGQEAWIVKNSWGTKWGVEGYVYMSTDGSINEGHGICGILEMPSIPYKNS